MSLEHHLSPLVLWLGKHTEKLHSVLSFSCSVNLAKVCVLGKMSTWAGDVDWHLYQSCLSKQRAV